MLRTSRYAASLFLFALALMSKPMAISLPFVLLIIDYYPLERLSFKGDGSTARCSIKMLAEKLPFFALAGGLRDRYPLDAALSAIKSFEALALTERLASGSLEGLRLLPLQDVIAAR